MPTSQAVDPHSFNCGKAGIGHCFTIKGKGGREIASGIIAQILYRKDWTVSAIIDEVGGLHEVPRGSTVESMLSAPNPDEEEDEVVACNVKLDEHRILNLGASPIFL